MDLLNLSAEPDGKLYAWLPHDLRAERVVFLPDACPGKSPLPTGTAVLTHQPDWRRFAISDCGCGMRLVRSSISPSDLTQEAWNAIADSLRTNKGGLGDLGGGNHFLDALAPYKDDRLYLLIHTGSRAESGHVDALVDDPVRFDTEFDRVVEWAAQNRAAVHEAAEQVIGPLDLVLDLPHNTFERLASGGAIIRKGSVRVMPRDLNIIPSHMSGDVALVRATDRVGESLNSLSHGTGRAMSRADCKPLAEEYDFDSLRKRVLIPSGIENASLRTDGPFAYRDLDTCLALLSGFAENVERFSVVAYMGHL
ncbi:MAG: RtcB family protein [Bacteroidota bacterium]